MVRRLEYLEVFLEGVKRGLGRKDLEAALGERKRAFEIEKDLALGRGKPHRKDIPEAGKLIEYCLKLSRELRLVDKVGSQSRLLDRGRKYLIADEWGRRRMFSEAYSEVYPHLIAVILALSRLGEGEAVLPLRNRPEFRPEAGRYGLKIGQMAFDTVRDVATSLGLVNWYVNGVGSERRQHVYLACQILEDAPESFLLKVRFSDRWIYAMPFEVDRDEFRDVLWDSYLSLVDGVPGSPVFYSSVRESVCASLRLRDDQFDKEVMQMVDGDAVLHVIWSEGVLPYQHDSASLLKSLPPKNEWGRYVVYLKIVRR
jgi:hypothetical protein